MGRCPLYPTGYRPVWLSGPSGTLGQVDLRLCACSPLDRYFSFSLDLQPSKPSKPASQPCSLTTWKPSRAHDAHIAAYHMPPVWTIHLLTNPQHCGPHRVSALVAGSVAIKKGPRLTSLGQCPWLHSQTLWAASPAPSKHPPPPTCAIPLRHIEAIRNMTAVHLLVCVLPMCGRNMGEVKLNNNKKPNYKNVEYNLPQCRTCQLHRCTPAPAWSTKKK